MGEEVRNLQRMKRIAAAAYDYDSDPRWADYWSNVLLPPHLAARSDVVDHYKRKFYQRFIDPDFIVEGISSVSSSQTSGASEWSSQSTAQSVRPQGSGSGSGTTQTTAATGNDGNVYRLDEKSIHFSANAWVDACTSTLSYPTALGRMWILMQAIYSRTSSEYFESSLLIVLIVALLGMFPLVPRNLSNKAYRLSLLGTACSSAYSLYKLYGKPRAWNLPSVQTWFRSVIGAKDFIHLMYCITLVSSQLHFKLALVPVFCWVVDHVARFLKRNFMRSPLYRTYMDEPCSWVEANGTTLNILSSHAEIALGFLLITSLFSWQRSIIQTIMYWLLLKLMYRAPVTASNHQRAWANFGRTLNPYIHRYAPFFSYPISSVQRWWFS